MAPRPAPSISAVLIVKDEEHYLARCLSSVRWADEIVVYDTGSTDRTMEIAREFTDKVIEGYWDDDFGAARNRALASATGEWVLSIDADETFHGADRALRERLAKAQADIYTLTITASVSAPGRPSATHMAARLFRRESSEFRGALHEQVISRTGRRVGVRPMPGVTLRHAGYSEGPEAMGARHQRNLAIAEREVSRAGAEASPIRALKTANLARALCAAGRPRDGLALAEELFTEGSLENLPMQTLAGAMAMFAAVSLADFGLAHVWVDRLRSVADNPVQADAALVQVTAVEGDPVATMDAVDRIPTVTVDARGRRTRRVDFAKHEIWALWRIGRVREAQRVATAAARAGTLPAEPLELWTWLGADSVMNVARELSDLNWQLLAVLCTHLPESPEARAVLRVMADVRPDDLAVLLCAAQMSYPDDLSGLEEAAQWSARMRGRGLTEECTLIAIAVHAERPATQRARAAALAHFAYQDPRALPALEAALAGVAPQEEEELLGHLDVLAPGLVQRA